VLQVKAWWAFVFCVSSSQSFSFPFLVSDAHG
jgi:hypothetical protein